MARLRMAMGFVGVACVCGGLEIMNHGPHWAFMLGCVGTGFGGAAILWALAP